MQRYKKWVLDTYGDGPAHQIPYGASLNTLKFRYFGSPISMGGSSIANSAIYLDAAGQSRLYGAEVHRTALAHAKRLRQRAHTQFMHRLP